MMNIVQAKQQVKDTIEAYLACDEQGRPLLDRARQRPVFLVGAPGIGKTAIMAQIAQELRIGLVSYSMTHHTRQSALGLPFIVHEEYDGLEYEASEYTMSEIIASVYTYMRKTKAQRGILFLDEINCVSETLYPSMLQFLQFKTFGRHAVPEGWVIVTAGNPPEYNKSVHEFDIVTLDRVKKISVEPDFQAWKSYAVAKGTHPAILTFLEIKKSRFYSIEASLEGKSFVTARGWDDLSDIMVLFERMGKPVDYDLIVQYVQHEGIAREFAAYCDLFAKYRDDYRIDDILAGEDAAEIIERAASAEFDERLSFLGLLLDALCAEMLTLVEDADVLVALRDDIRGVQKAVGEGGDISELVADIEKERTSQLELSLAAGNLSKSRRAMLERELQQLASFALLVRGSTDSARGFALVADAYRTQTEAL
ncbi:MAG: ATP-binding protein, partial [Raoultibacter sp.]